MSAWDGIFRDHQARIAQQNYHEATRRQVDEAIAQRDAQWRQHLATVMDEMVQIAALEALAGRELKIVDPLNPYFDQAIQDRLAKVVVRLQREEQGGVKAARDVGAQATLPPHERGSAPGTSSLPGQTVAADEINRLRARLAAAEAELEAQREAANQAQTAAQTDVIELMAQRAAYRHELSLLNPDHLLLTEPQLRQILNGLARKAFEARGGDWNVLNQVGAQFMAEVENIER